MQKPFIGYLVKQKGFSLVEVLVALFIISIGVVFFGYFAKSLKTTGSARFETEAMITMRSALNNTRTLWSDEKGYSNIYLPYLIDAPKGYQNLSIDIESLSTTTRDLNYNCVYTFLPDLQKFENTCNPLTEEDIGSLIRHVEFTLTDNQKEPLVLSMQLSRPVK